VLVHRMDGLTGSVVCLHNLSDEPAVVDFAKVSGVADARGVLELFGDGEGERLEPGPLGQVPMPGYGYRWIRLLDLGGE
jgi:maltose alpha-D-glucosyltransferase / alpha-amylase